ncbi:MAG: cellulase family glycosylhydrolase, partial [Candidatus Omnitrophota bacterium]
MKRRQFLTAASALMAGAAIPIPARAETSEQITASHIPPLKGFNLLEKFTLRGNKPYIERDFEWMAQWGFNFVRLPMDYRCWTDSADPKKLDEKVLKEIDQVVEWGKQYKIHINLNLHRAPGYCVNPPEEPLDLWTS